MIDYNTYNNKGRKPDRKESELWNFFTKNIKKIEREQTCKEEQSSISRAEKTEHIKSGKKSISYKEITELKDFSPSLSEKNTYQKNDKSFTVKDKKTITKIKKGKISIEAILDLHGMNKNNAYERLIRFISDSHSKNRRLVLIITGKGNNTKNDDLYMDETEYGVLRNKLPKWLEAPKLSKMVLSYSQATNMHGGQGAWYVFLKKNKK